MVGRSCMWRRIEAIKDRDEEQRFFFMCGYVIGGHYGALINPLLFKFSPYN
jgi:hypothetical protein